MASLNVLSSRHGTSFKSLKPPDNQMITPMVARLVRDPFDREGWLFEVEVGYKT